MMSVLAALIGIDTASWGVIVGLAALATSAYSAFGARGSARAAERSADATTAAARASAQAASAAEVSAEHSERSAVAAERSAAAHERAVELDEGRVGHETRERADRDAPRWAPVAESEAAWWVSDDNQLSGTLVNAGRVAAIVTDVRVELPNGGQRVGRFRAEPPGPADGGFVSTLSVRAGGAMAIEFQTTDGSLGRALVGNVRPRVTVNASNDELPWQGTRTIELLRTPGGVSAPRRWKPRPID